MPPGWVPRRLCTSKTPCTAPSTSSNLRVLGPLGASKVLPCMGSHTQATGMPCPLTALISGGSACLTRSAQVSRRGVRADLDANGIADPAGDLDMSAVQRAGTLADPQEVRRGVVATAALGVFPGQGLLIVQQQRLVAGVQLNRAQLIGVGAACPHERQRPGDLPGQPLVPLPGRALRDEVLVPGMHLVQVGVTAGGERAA